MTDDYSPNIMSPVYLSAPMRVTGPRLVKYPSTVSWTLAMFNKAVLTTLFAVIMSSTDAFAWTAVATWNGRFSFTPYNQSTPVQAKEEALKGCQEVAMEKCEILGDAVTRTATVEARNVAGNTQLFIVSRPDPLEAAKEVMRTCRLHKGDCVITNAVWDGGPTWWAIASAEDSWNIYMSADTEQDARDRAILGCEERASKKGTCKVDSTGSGRGYAAVANGDNGAGVGYGDTKLEAEKAALKECGDKTCKVTGSDLNQGLIPPPTTMKQVEKMAADGIARMRKLGRWID